MLVFLNTQVPEQFKIYNYLANMPESRLSCRRC